MNHNAQGFTLIETILYIGLLSILIGSTLFSAYSLIEGSDTTRAAFVAGEEANFILKKMNWALTGATAITSPAAGATSTSLILTRSGLPPGENPLTFGFSAGVIELTRGTGASAPLSTENVVVEDLVFTHQAPSGSKPAALLVSFTIDDRNFEMTRYLRQ
jgi:type II secretory pathway pseudopilin PulG